MLANNKGLTNLIRPGEQFNTPVLLIIFNRPEMTRAVFNKIREVKPTSLYIAADGPRKEVASDAKLCEQTKSIVANIDWDCKVETLFRENNVGCGLGPSGAITWFFEHVEMGIILEDDCVPSIPFFYYCEYMLEKYKNNEQVWIISGRLHCPNSKEFGKYDYVFSNYAYTWGWATWKRCWQHFEIDIEDKWRSFYEAGGFKNVHFTKFAGIFNNMIFKKLYRDSELKLHSWDHQFMFAMYANRGLGVIPARNLIENIGYEGTHFSGATSWLKLKASKEFSIVDEPQYIIPNRKYDEYHTRQEFVTRLKTFIINKLRSFKK